MILRNNNAKFITLEGIDGAGKSTHLNWLAELLRSQGKNVLVTREPGGTPLGEALREGTWVISDRFTDASFAYQGGGRGLDESKLKILEQWVQQDLQPDLTLLFDVTLEVSRQRLSGNASLDRFEQEKQDFFQRVRDAYLKRAAQFPERIRVIDSGRALNEIQVDLEDVISSI